MSIKKPKIVMIGERLGSRAFNGANKALPVLASSLHNYGYDNVIQMDLERPTLTLEEVINECKDADSIWFVGALATQWPEIDKHSKMIYDSLSKERKKNVPIIVGGYAVKGVEPIAEKTPWITAYFNGEGEKGAVELAESIEKGTFSQDKSKIKGLCFMDERGIFHESIADRVENLDGFDQNYGLVHVSGIHNMNIFTENGRQLKTAQLYCQRGCPYKCGFCNKSKESKEVRFVGDAWFEELVKGLRKHGFEAVYLDDDTETISQREFRSKLEILSKYGLKVGMNTRIDIEADRLRKLRPGEESNIKFARDHGCVYQFFGVEHTDPGVLMAIEKFQGSVANQERRAEQYREDVKLVFQEMERCNVPSSYFLIIGLPKEIKEKWGPSHRPTTLEEDEEEIRFALEKCNPDYLNFNILRFMPGSKAADVLSSPFRCVSPSKKSVLKADWFLPRVRRLSQYGKYSYKDQEYHPVFRLYESLTENQPRSIAITPERAYETMGYAINLINQRIDQGKKATQLFVDHEVMKKGLVKRDTKGHYWIAPINDFRILESK
jgi:anaerobic magnesium-protoporphyrin IX monomethyl ester cyclase